jgi:hypothetical protein
LEDADEDDLRLSDKWVTIDVLVHAAHAAHEEAVRLKEGLGVTE